MADGGRGIQSIEVSGKILRSLIMTGRPTMLKDLAESADLKPAQCHAYLTSLKNVGLVHQDMSTGLYSAGAFALRMGVSWLNGNPQTARAIAELKTMTEDFGVMSLICMWGQFGPTVAHIYAGLTQAALNLKQGSVFSTTGSATGRLFAAYGDSPEIEAHVEAELSRKARSHALGEVLTTEAFEDHIHEIRSHGYSVAREVPIPGLNAVSFPVFTQDGELAFIISLTGAADRLPVEDDSPAVQRLRHLAQELSTEGQPLAIQSDG